MMRKSDGNLSLKKLAYITHVLVNPRLASVTQSFATFLARSTWAFVLPAQPIARDGLNKSFLYGRPDASDDMRRFHP
jgi:hypothetical protein